MAAVARKLLGTDDLFYSGDSAVTINGTQKGFHKDNADRVDPQAPDWEDRYTQLRFGIYCQDHSEHTGGLNLRIGSHDIANTTEGENLYVKTKPGDLAVWNMRITHSGNGMLLKDPQAPYPLPTEHDTFAPEEVADADGDRIAVFVHIGANDKHAKRYSDYTKTRTYLCGRLAQAAVRRRDPSGRRRRRSDPAGHAGRGHGRLVCRTERAVGSDRLRPAQSLTGYFSGCPCNGAGHRQAGSARPGCLKPATCKESCAEWGQGPARRLASGRVLGTITRPVLTTGGDVGACWS